MQVGVALSPFPFLQAGFCHCRQFSIGGVSVQLSGACADDVTLAPGLAPFEVQCAEPDVEVEVEWVGALSPSPGRLLFDSGATWRLHQELAGLSFEIRAPILGKDPCKRLRIDREFRRATLQLSRGAFARSGSAAAPLEYPLDELLIMHRLPRERAIELHGSGIVRANGEGSLFVGHSGAGKSTTTRLWTESQPVEVLSDDRIIVRQDAAAPTGMRMYGTPWHGEAMYASPHSSPLARIFILEHGTGHEVTRLGPSQAVSELLARAFVPFHTPEFVDAALGFLQSLADSVPVYRYAFRPDRRAVETIVDLHE